MYILLSLNFLCLLTFDASAAQNILSALNISGYTIAALSEKAMRETAIFR